MSIATNRSDFESDSVERQDEGDYRDQAAQRRRAALRELIAERNLTLKDLATGAGIGSAAAIGNFLNGRTSSLNLATLEPLARYMKVTINRLVGEPEPTKIPGSEAHICGNVATGQWRRQFWWPPEEWIPMTVPLQIKNYGQSYFLRLDTTEMDQVYSPGTILEVVDLKNFTRDLRHGNRVIVTRTTPEGFVETGCREIVQDGETSQIVTRSSDARFRERMMPIPWPIIPERQIETPNGNVIEIRGVVVRSLRDEIDG